MPSLPQRVSKMLSVGLSDEAKKKIKTGAKIGAGVGVVGGAANLLSDDEGEEAVLPPTLPANPIPETKTTTKTIESIPTGGEDDKQETPKDLIEKVKFSTDLKFESAPSTADLDKSKVSYDKELSRASSLVNDAMNLYKQEKDIIKSKQLWESIINAVGMIAAGAYGLKTGSDMSGAKFTSTDWSKELDSSRAELENSMKQSDRVETAAARARSIAAEDYRTLASAVSDRNRNLLQKVQLDLQGKIASESATLDRIKQAADEDYKNKLAAIQNNEQSAKVLTALSKGDDSVQKAVIKATSLIADAADKKAETKKAAYAEAQLVLNQAGVNVPPELFEKKGLLWGSNLKDPAEIIKGMGSMAATGPAQAEAPTSAPQGMVTMVEIKTGKEGQIPESAVAAAEKTGNFRRK